MASRTDRSGFYLRIAVILAIVVGAFVLTRGRGHHSASPARTAPTQHVTYAPSAPAPNTTSFMVGPTLGASQSASSSQVTTPVPAPLPVTTDPSLSAVVDRFERAFSVYHYTDTDYDRIARLKACDCATTGVIDSYTQALAATVTTATPTVQQAEQLDVLVSPVRPSDLTVTQSDNMAVVVVTISEQINEHGKLVNSRYVTDTLHLTEDHGWHIVSLPESS